MNLIKRSKSREPQEKADASMAQDETHAIKSPILKSRNLTEENLKQRQQGVRDSLIKREAATFGTLTVIQPVEFGDDSLEELHEHPMPHENLSPVVREEDAASLQKKAQEQLAHARKDAERTLAEAQSKARKLIEQSKLYTDTALSQAEREGFAEGMEKGREAAIADVRALMETARDALAQVKELHDNLARSMEGGLAKLAVNIAQKVIGREVSLDPDLVIAMVRSQLEKMKDRDHVIIHVNPDDYENVKYKKDLFAQFAPHVRSLEIQADPRVERGACMVETDLGTVDATISTQLEAIELAFSKMSRLDTPSGESET